MSVVEGTVAFANLTETERFNGQDTGKYSVVLQLDEDSKSKLESSGVKVKMYKDTPQRKFSTKFDGTRIVDTNDDPVSKSRIRYGAKVRVAWDAGDEHPVHGTGTYLKAIRLLEDAPEGNTEDDF